MTSGTALSFVLHSRKFRDSSLILELLTRDEGRFSAVARGVTRKRAYVPQAFTPLLVRWSGNSELKTVMSVEPAGPAFPLVGRSLMTALYVNEIVYRLLGRFDVQPRIFDGYALLLNELCVQNFDEAHLRRFEMLLLESLGYGLNLVTVGGGTVAGASVSGGSGDGPRIGGGFEPFAPDGTYRFVPAEGFVNALPGDREPVPGRVLLALARGEFDDEVRLHARRITRRALGFVLGGRELRSRELFQTGPARPGNIGGKHV